MQKLQLHLGNPAAYSLPTRDASSSDAVAESLRCEHRLAVHLNGCDRVGRRALCHLLSYKRQLVTTADPPVVLHDGGSVQVAPHKGGKVGA